MTVGTETNKSGPYNGNGSTTDFSVTFDFFDEGDIDVYLIDSAGTATLQTISTHYTVTGGDGTTGTVTFVTAPASGEKVTIIRDQSLTQDTDYVENDAFAAAVQEDQLDKIVMQMQMIAELSERTPRMDIATTLSNIEFPVQANGYLKWNSAANGLELDTASGPISGITASDGVFIVGDGTEFVGESGSTARTSLGLGSIATQAASSVSITGGSITGITDLAIGDGGTGASTASAARSNLGLAIGSDVQAFDAGLSDIAGLAVTNSNIIVGDGANWVAESGATARASLGLTIGTDVLGAVVDDTTPQLGGDLDVNSNSLVSTSNGNITLNPNGTGNVVLGNYTLDGDQSVGAAQDDFILTYDDASGLIQLESNTGASGAPNDAQYLTLATNATLTVERVLTAGNYIGFTDGGAGSTLTVDVDDASDTAAGAIEVAVQSEQEAGSSTTLAVTPGRQHYHPSASKAWIYARVPSGVPGVTTSYNVTSIVDNGVGDYTVNWATDFSSGDYAVVEGLNRAGTVGMITTHTQAAGNIDIVATNSTGNVSDPTAFHLITMGDH